MSEKDEKTLHFPITINVLIKREFYLVVYVIAASYFNFSLFLFL